MAKINNYCWRLIDPEESTDFGLNFTLWYLFVDRFLIYID